MNAALLNRAHLIIFLLLLVVKILRPKYHLFITNLINLSLVSPTHNTGRKKRKKKAGLTCILRDLDLAGQPRATIINERVEETSIYILFIRKFSHFHFTFKYTNCTINFKFQKINSLPFHSTYSYH